MFVEIMAEVRKSRKLTQAEMAERVKCSERMYGAYERREADMPWDVKVFVAKTTKEPELVIALLDELDTPFAPKVLQDDNHHAYQLHRGLKELSEALESMRHVNLFDIDRRAVEDAIDQAFDVLHYLPTVIAALCRAFGLPMWELWKRNLAKFKAKGKLREDAN